VIAKIVSKPNYDDEQCSACEKESVYIVIKGQANCYYCGNEIALCLDCFNRMKNEITEFEANPVS